MTLCKNCGCEMDAGLLDGVCASCLLDDVVNGDGSTEDGHQGHELLGEIARGGMGVVYRARQLEPERIVALKTLRGASLDSAEARARFRHEADVMVSLDHPAILPVYHFGEVDGVPFFTMKLADGGTLADRVESFAGQWRDIAALMSTLCDAVRHAHERGVLHRDLKPGNVLFDAAGHVFVSDFGIAKLADSPSAGLTMTLSLLGTPYYLAPEVAAGGAKAASVASDVWSLGVVLFELLTGERPFKGESVTMVLRALDIADAPRPASLRPDVPRDLEVITLKALSRDPARRYASAQGLADDLRAWLEGRPIQARAVPVHERAWMWARRNPMLAATVALFAAALFAAASSLVWGFVRVREENARVAASQAETRAQLREALLLQARAGRLAGEMGWRAAGLRALHRAMNIRPGDELRDEMIAHLAGYDFSVDSSLPGVLRESSMLFFSPGFEKVVGYGPGRSIGVFDAGSGTMTRLEPPPSTQLGGAAFDPQGRWLAVRSLAGELSLRAAPSWSEAARLPPRTVENARLPLEFSLDGGRLVVEARDAVKVLRTGDWTVEATLPRPISGTTVSVCQEPALELACRLNPEGLEIVDWRTGAIKGRMRTAGRPVLARWCQDRLLVLLDKGHFQYLDFRRGSNASLSAHDSMSAFMLMPRDRSLLLASSVDGMTLLAHPGSGQRLCLARGLRVEAMSDDGSRFAVGGNPHRLGKIEHSACLKPLPDHVLNLPVFNPFEGLDSSPDGRWTLEMDTARLAVREVASGRLAAWADLPMIAAARFLPSGKDILVAQRRGLSLWTLERRGRQVGLRKVRGIAPPSEDEIAWAQIAGSRTRLSLKTWSGRSFTTRLGPEELAWTEIEPGIDAGHQVQFDVDDRWTVTKGSGLDMLAGATGEPAAPAAKLVDYRDLPSVATASPDGKWMAAVTMSRELRVFRTGTWEEVHRMAQSSEKMLYVAPPPAWAPSGRWLAVARDMAEVDIIEAGSWRVLARLRGPLRSAVVLMRVTGDERRLIVRRQSGTLESWDLVALARDLAAAGARLELPSPEAVPASVSPPELQGDFDDPDLPPMVFPQDASTTVK